MKKLRIIHNLARSGGTLISKCIASMQDIVLLSEINPHKKAQVSQTFGVAAQARDWYGVDVNDAQSETPNLPYMVEKMDQFCQGSQKTLVIRDWAHADYIGPPIIKPPPYRLTLDELLHEQWQIISFTIVRHPADTWVSLSKIKFMQQAKIDVHKYLYGYRRFIEDIGDEGILKFEDFTEFPERSMQWISTQLDIPYDREFVDKWYDYRNITGDNGGNSRAGHAVEIRKLRRPDIDDSLRKEIESDKNYHWLLGRLRYEDL